MKIEPGSVTCPEGKESIGVIHSICLHLVITIVKGKEVENNTQALIVTNYVCLQIMINICEIYINYMALLSTDTFLHCT